MKLSSLDTASRSTLPASVERSGHVQPEQIQKVEAGESVNPDRQRSLQQELAQIEPEALAEFEGGALILRDAHDLARRIAEEGMPDGLINASVLAGRLPSVDDQA